jgi:hypothetical protein
MSCWHSTRFLLLDIPRMCEPFLAMNFVKILELSSGAKTILSVPSVIYLEYSVLFDRAWNWPPGITRFMPAQMRIVHQVPHLGCKMRGGAGRRRQKLASWRVPRLVRCCPEALNWLANSFEAGGPVPHLQKKLVITKQVSSAAMCLHSRFEERKVKCRKGGPLSSSEREPRASPGSLASRFDDSGRHPYPIGGGS